MKGLPELVIGDLKVKRPVIQGGMGVGVSLGQLAGAVAKEGGVGIISTAQIGFREPDFETNTRAANIRAIGSEFQRAVSEFLLSASHTSYVHAHKQYLHVR